jgi:serine/threonine-protein kinase ATR
LINSSDLVDPLITSCVQALLKATRDTDPANVQLAAKCLGILGAIDPGRLEKNGDLSACNVAVALSIADESCAYDLLNVLVRAFVASSGSSHAEQCGYAIQEAMKAYGINGPGMLSSVPGRVWNRLSDSSCEVLQPFIRSHYLRSDSQVTYTIPIFKSRLGQTYLQWISDWCCHLVTKVKEKAVKAVFIACIAALKKDTNTAQFLLPYIVCAVLTTGDNAAVAEVSEEINAVLNAEKENNGESAESNRRRRSSSSFLSTAESAPVQKLDRLAAQTVFAILDYLNKWMREKQNKMLQKMNRTDTIAKAKSSDDQYMSVERFVDSISQKKLATASYHCQAYARSLLHWETHLSAHAQDLQSSLFTLQQVCGALQEQDLVAGLAVIRKKEPSVEELVYEHEIAGDYGDALACYESVGKSTKCQGAEDEACGMVRCYLEIDRPHTAAALAKGLLQRQPDCRDRLKKYELEAAWQLSQWGDIDERDGVGNKDWSPCLARLLKCVQTENKKTFYTQMESVLKMEVAPITAAAMEQGTYERSYDHLVKLQILNEVQSIADMLFFTNIRDLPPADVVDDLVTGWKNRTAVAQYSARFLEPVIKVRCIFCCSTHKRYTYKKI